MVMGIMNKASYRPSKIYDEEGMRQLIEDHVEKLRTSSNTEALVLEEYQRHRFEGDFLNLMQELRVPVHMHYAVMRVNGLTHPQEFSVDHEVLLMPQEAEVSTIQRLYTTYRHTKKKSGG